MQHEKMWRAWRPWRQAQHHPGSSPDAVWLREASRLPWDQVLSFVKGTIPSLRKTVSGEIVLRRRKVGTGIARRALAARREGLMPSVLS